MDRTGADTVKKYVEELELTFPTLHDQTSKIASQYGVRGVPTTYVIDANGKAVGGAVGPRPWNSEEVYGLVEQLLKEAN